MMPDVMWVCDVHRVRPVPRAQRSISALSFSIELKQLDGTKNLLSLSVEHANDRSLPLNMVFCLVNVLCSGWWSLSKTDSLLRVPFFSTSIKDSSSMPTTEPGFLTSLSSHPVFIFLMLPPQQHSTEEDAGHDRPRVRWNIRRTLLQMLKMPKPPQEIKLALPFSVDCNVC